MEEIKYRYFKIIGISEGKRKVVCIKKQLKPSIDEAAEICKEYLQSVLDIKETTEDLVCYGGV